MALTCKHGGRACNGCMDCLESEKTYYCRCCGKRLDEDADVYIDKRDGEVVGCEKCLKRVSAYEME